MGPQLPEPRERDSESAQIAVLQVDEALGAHARQKVRQAAGARAFEFLHASVSNQDAQVSLQALLDCVVQGETERSDLLRAS